MIRALVFDVFGTLVDWRSGVAREAARLLGAEAPTLDADAFADAWRRHYGPSMETVRSGARPFVDLDTLHAESLPLVLAEFGIVGAPDATRRELVQAWHRLDAWPDVPHALRRLRTRHLLAPNSNGHIRLMADLARRNGLIFDAILGVGPFPRLQAETGPLSRCGGGLRLRSGGDLDGRRPFGRPRGSGEPRPVHTAHIARPREHGPGGGETAPNVPITYAARDLTDLADQLGC